MIYAVIDQMYDAIPVEEHANYSELIEILGAVKKDWLFKAPEQMPEAFRFVSGVLDDYLGDPAGVLWKEKIRDIFADKVT